MISPKNPQVFGDHKNMRPRLLTGGSKHLTKPQGPELIHTVYASHAIRLKGEDGLRVQRIVIGGDVVLCAVVVDGHGGHQAALLVVTCIIELLCEESQGDASGRALSRALERAFARLHAKLLQDDLHTAGTAVTVCLLNETRRELTTAHVGDAAAFLVPAAPNVGAHQHAAIPLTCQHRLDDSQAERRRVKATGGRLGKTEQAGPVRAYPGGVACARALGDSDCGPWLSPIPDTSVLPFPEGSYLLIASDGVWDAMAPETAVKLACEEKDVHNASKRVAVHALAAHGPSDDITCICIIGGRAQAGGSVHGGSVHGGSVHGGSVHGGSVHGGSMHGGSVHGGSVGSGSVHGGSVGSGGAYSGAGVCDHDFHHHGIGITPATLSPRFMQLLPKPKSLGNETRRGETRSCTNSGDCGVGLLGLDGLAIVTRKVSTPDRMVKHVLSAKKGHKLGIRV